jgi:hypothetical protein
MKFLKIIIMTINIKSQLFFIAFLGMNLIAKAQSNWHSTCNGSNWFTPPPCNITFSSSSSNGTTVNFAPYYS